MQYDMQTDSCIAEALQHRSCKTNRVTEPILESSGAGSVSVLLAASRAEDFKRREMDLAPRASWVHVVVLKGPAWWAGILQIQYLSEQHTMPLCTKAEKELTSVKL